MIPLQRNRNVALLVKRSRGRNHVIHRRQPVRCVHEAIPLAVVVSERKLFPRPVLIWFRTAFGR